MPAIRVGRSDQIALAIEGLKAVASRSAGLTIEPADDDEGVTVSRAGRRPWKAKVYARRSLSPAEARALIAAENGEEANVVVADQISAEAKGHLAQAPGWSWLDRRGELRLRRGATEFEIRFAPDTAVGIKVDVIPPPIPSPATTSTASTMARSSSSLVTAGRSTPLNRSPWVRRPRRPSQSTSPLPLRC